MSEASLYDVFLSHNGHDKPLAEQIAQRLVTEANLQPFLDKWHLIPGAEWQGELEDALRRSKTVAVFIGSSCNGPWHHEETQLVAATGSSGSGKPSIIGVGLFPQLAPDAIAQERNLGRFTWIPDILPDRLC
jgi:hypothetical protein